VEILTTGQTLLPPTIHPDTGVPYYWLTKDTLFNTAINHLPTLTEGHLQLLEEALAPWLPKRIERVTQQTEVSEPVNDTRMQAYARTVLAAKVRELAGMVNGGRNDALFNAACCVGRYVHHKIITPAEMENALIGACASAWRPSGRA